MARAFIGRRGLPPRGRRGYPASPSSSRARLMPRLRPLPAVALLSLSLLAALPATPAQAQSRRERAEAKRDAADSAALQQRMDAAEKRYRDAMLAVDEEAAATATSAALTEMKAVVDACAKQHGCSMDTMLATYERLLKAAPQFDDMTAEDGSADPIDETDLDDADVPDSANAVSLLSEEGKRFVSMVQFNPAVQAGIRRWLTDMRPSLMDSYENYRYMQHLMSPAFKRHGLPEALLFGIMAKESNGKVHAGSRVGAVGPLQFMPATGRRFGLGNDGTGFDTRYDPAASADAAAQYLQERMAQLNNSIELSLAGYNGGEGRALRVFRDTGGRSFWDVDVYNQFPAETKDYVPMVIAAAWLFLHPKEYGIRWPRISARPATVTLSQPTSLYELTICLGNWGSRDGYLRALRNLNPRWEPGQILPAGTALNATSRIAWLYRFNCTRGKRLELARQVMAGNVQSALVRVGEPTSVVAASAATVPPPAATPRAPVKPQSKTKTYKVQRGDTLGGIARKLQCDIGDLAKANKLKKPKYAIKPGQSLKLDGCG
jgi:membrane-bound lytic murein transglycosylase D